MTGLHATWCPLHPCSCGVRDALPYDDDLPTEIAPPPPGCEVSLASIRPVDDCHGLLGPGPVDIDRLMIELGGV